MREHEWMKGVVEGFNATVEILGSSDDDNSIDIAELPVASIKGFESFEEWSNQKRGSLDIPDEETQTICRIELDMIGVRLRKKIVGEAVENLVIDTMRVVLEAIITERARGVVCAPKQIKGRILDALNSAVKGKDIPGWDDIVNIVDANIYTLDQEIV